MACLLRDLGIKAPSWSLNTLNLPLFNVNMPKLPFQNVSPGRGGGSSAINMFSNSKMSEFDLGGGQHFSNKCEIQKSLNYLLGGGGLSSQIGSLSKIILFVVLIMMPPLVKIGTLLFFSDSISNQ